MKYDPIQPIHYIGYSAQPYVQIYCINEERYVLLDDTGMDQVYCAEGPDTKDVYDGSIILYTFDWSKITCERCKAKKSVLTTCL